MAALRCLPRVQAVGCGSSSRAGKCTAPHLSGRAVNAASASTNAAERPRDPEQEPAGKVPSSY
jgi:fructoselysine-6-P-deglycase FrlB-like protein